MMLLGRELEEAEEMLRTARIAYETVTYRSRKPYADEDSRRVVRAVRKENGAYKLTVCGFKTSLHSASQG
jgi:hypothetical protein